MDANDEVALIVNFIVRRQLLGHAYRMLQPDYFDKMPVGSGVFLQPLVPTHEIFPGVHRPGDIDLLIIPYENDALLLDRVVAIEFKVIRAAFSRQGKSPNDFGYTQALALLELGFPYAAIGHLIVSDTSPPEYWHEVTSCEILDDEGRVGNMTKVAHDMMPSDLMTRALGRLKANTPSSALGLLASYLSIEGRSSIDVKRRGDWIPEAQLASLTHRMQIRTLDAVETYFHRNAEYFLRTPRYDPPQLSNSPLR